MTVEICANNYQSAINAQKAGAHRIELCEDLNVGGITPNMQLVKKVLDELNIPVFVLIRPRSGDFVYSEGEFLQMKEDIGRFKSLGISGIVAGILKKDNTIDIERTKELITLSRPLPFTFHRAFDEVTNPLEALEQVIDLGAARILTSGQHDKAVNGLPLLKQLKEKANGRITIIPGSGVNPQNVIMFKEAGFAEIHASATNGGKISNLDTIQELLKAIG